MKRHVGRGIATIWLGLLFVASAPAWQPVPLAAQSKAAPSNAARSDAGTEMTGWAAEAAPSPISQSDRLQAAVDALTAGNPGAALAALDRIIAESPEIAAAYFYRGLALLALRRPAEAADAFSRATTIAPENDEAWAYMGSARRLAGDPEGALFDLRVAADRLDHNPGLLASVHHERGLALIALGDLTAALEALQRAVELAPERVPIQFDLAVASLRSGEKADARSRFWHIATMAPDFIEAPLALALLAYEEGRPGEALHLLGPVATRAPSRGDVQFILGIVYRQLDRLDAAQEALERALELGHDVPAVHYHLSAVLHPVGELDDAKRHLRQAIIQDPSFFDAHLTLGRVEVDLGNMEEAVLALSAASNLSPESAEVHAVLGDTQLKAGQIEAAIASLQRALEIDPRERSALYALAQALRRRRNEDDAAEARRLLELHGEVAEQEVRQKEGAARAQTELLQAQVALNNGQPDQAKVALQRALSAEPGLVNAQVLLVFLIAQEGTPELAVRELRGLAERNPVSADARYYLGRALEMVSDTAAAESAYRSALELENGRPDVRLELGRLLSRSGRPREALEVLEPALAVAPDLQPLRDAIQQARELLGPEYDQD